MLNFDSSGRDVFGGEVFKSKFKGDDTGLILKELGFLHEGQKVPKIDSSARLSFTFILF